MGKIEDYTYLGHEYIITQNTYSNYSVDIREDNEDGAIIGAYTDLFSTWDATTVAHAFIDGLERGE